MVICVQMAGGGGEETRGGIEEAGGRALLNLGRAGNSGGGDLTGTGRVGTTDGATRALRIVNGSKGGSVEGGGGGISVSGGGEEGREGGGVTEGGGGTGDNSGGQLGEKRIRSDVGVGRISGGGGGGGGGGAVVAPAIHKNWFTGAKSVEELTGAGIDESDLKDISGTTAAMAKKMSDEQREVMLMKRKLRNRLSAWRSRQRKKKGIAGGSGEKGSNSGARSTGSEGSAGTGRAKSEVPAEPSVSGGGGPSGRTSPANVVTAPRSSSAKSASSGSGKSPGLTSRSTLIRAVSDTDKGSMGHSNEPKLTAGGMASEQVQTSDAFRKTKVVQSLSVGDEHPPWAGRTADVEMKKETAEERTIAPNQSEPPRPAVTFLTSPLSTGNAASTETFPGPVHNANEAVVNGGIPPNNDAQVQPQFSYLASVDSQNLASLPETQNVASVLLKLQSEQEDLKRQYEGVSASLTYLHSKQKRMDHETNILKQDNDILKEEIRKMQQKSGTFKS